MTNNRRVQNFAAEGVEVLVASDHAHVSDLSPNLSAEGLEPWLNTIASQEVTCFDYGHFGLFPMEHDPKSPNGGAFDWVGVSPVDLFIWAGDQPRDMVVQINHPRAIPTSTDTQNFFDLLDLQFDVDGPYIGPNRFEDGGSGLPVDAEIFGPGYTAMEVMNWLNIQGLSDWFNLLNSGARFSATANSDSHTVNVESAGWPRNFILVGEDDPSQMDEDALVSAVNNQHLVGSFGPIVTLHSG